jgi:hypothetical protein
MTTIRSCSPGATGESFALTLIPTVEIYPLAWLSGTVTCPPVSRGICTGMALCLRVSRDVSGLFQGDSIGDWGHCLRAIGAQ